MILPKSLRLLLFVGAFALTSSLFAADPILPDLRITAGVYRKNLSRHKICHTKWGLINDNSRTQLALASRPPLERLERKCVRNGRKFRGRIYSPSFVTASTE
jgi:hypothetical protein